MSTKRVGRPLTYTYSELILGVLHAPPYDDGLTVKEIEDTIFERTDIILNRHTIRYQLQSMIFAGIVEIVRVGEQNILYYKLKADT